MDRAADPNQELSPELALVSPELAEEARARLPDRPWEVFVPPAQPVLVLAQPSRPQRTPPRPRRRRRLRVRPALTALGILALLVAGFLPASDSPTLEPAPPPRSPSPVVPTPGALYGIDADIALVISTDSGSVVRITSLPCLPEGAELNALIRPDGTFGVHRGDQGGVQLDLQGRFVESTVVQGSYHVRAPDCDSGLVEFVARRR